jgi:hypothetical protein
MRTRPVADQRIARGVAASLSFQFTDASGAAAAPAGTATVGITRADGTVLVAPGAATSGATTAPRTYALTAANNLLLDLLTVTWTDSGDGSTNTTLVEVVGGFYFSVLQARAAEPSLQDTAKYPTADVEARRREVEDEAEDICAAAFVPRYRRVTLHGSGDRSLTVPDTMLRTLRSVTVAGVAWSAGQLANVTLSDFGVLSLTTGTWPSGRGNIVVGYEHGYDRPPSGLAVAALTRLRSRLNLVKSDIPDRAERYVGTEGGVFALSMPGPGRTGIPDVDAVYERYSLAVPGMA